MIIGYQLVGKSGDMFANKSENFVMTEKTVIEQQTLARKGSAHYNIIAVTKGDIQNPIFESELLNTTDRYNVLGVSNIHLSAADITELDTLSESKDCNMVMKRDTGWFVKLYEEFSSDDYKLLSDELTFILENAHKANYRMVEFDCDAFEYEMFTQFDR